MNYDSDWCWHREEGAGAGPTTMVAAIVLGGAKSSLEAFPSSGFEVPTATNRVAVLREVLVLLQYNFWLVWMEGFFLDQNAACMRYYTPGVRESSA